MGHVVVELTNTKTGKTRTITKKNLVGDIFTNAPAYLAFGANGGSIGGVLDLSVLSPSRSIKKIVGSSGGVDSTTSSLNINNYNAYNVLSLINCGHDYTTDYTGTPHVPNVVSGQITGFATGTTASPNLYQGHFEPSTTSYNPKNDTLTAYFPANKANGTFNTILLGNDVPTVNNGVICSTAAGNIVYENTPNFLVTIDNVLTTSSANSYLYYPYVDDTTIGGGMLADGSGTAIYYNSTSKKFVVYSYQIQGENILMTTRQNLTLSSTLNWNSGTMNYFESANYYHVINQNFTSNGNLYMNRISKSDGTVLQYNFSAGFASLGYACGKTSQNQSGTQTLALLRKVQGVGKLEIKTVNFTDTAFSAGQTVAVTCPQSWSFLNTTSTSAEVFAANSLQCILDNFVIAGRKIPIADFLENNLQEFYDYQLMYDTAWNRVVTPVNGANLRYLFYGDGSSLYIERSCPNGALIQLGKTVTKTADDVLKIIYYLTTPVLYLP